MGPEDVVDKCPALFWNEANKLLRRHALELLWGIRGEHDVDAVRLVIHMIVDPAEHVLQVLNRIPRRSQCTHTARLTDGGHHVLTMREREDRCLQAKHLHRLRFHDYLLLLRCRR